jgi:superkiller protein 3
MCLYLIGEVYRQTGQFEQAIESYQNVLGEEGTSDNIVGVRLALADAYLSLGLQQVAAGFLHRSEISFAACMRIAIEIIVSSAGLRRLGWKRAGDAATYLSKLQSFSDEKLVISCLISLGELLAASPVNKSLSSFMETVQMKSIASPRQCLQLAIWSYDKYLELGPHDSRTRGAICFDLSVTLRRLSQMITHEDKKNLCWIEAVKNCKRAIQSEPQNAAYWTVLGDLHFFGTPKLAQHAYIQAIDFDTKVR